MSTVSSRTTTQMGRTDSQSSSQLPETHKRRRRAPNELVWTQPRTIPANLHKNARRMAAQPPESPPTKKESPERGHAAQQRRQQSTMTSLLTPSSQPSDVPSWKMDTDFFDLGGMSDVADDVAVHNLMHSLPDGSSFTGLQSTDQHSYSLHDMDDTSFMDSRIAALVDDCIEASEFLPPTTTGQRLNLSSLNGLSAIHLAAHSGKFPIIRLLLSACPEDVDLLSHDSQTPLHIAAAEGRAEVVPELLRSGANAMLQDVDGRTALHLAASRGHIEVVRVLLDDTQGQAMIRMSDAVGKTALHHAVLQERDEIVRLLLEKGADPRTRVG